jgi:hypothetical protein
LKGKNDLLVEDGWRVRNNKLLADLLHCCAVLTWDDWLIESFSLLGRLGGGNNTT